MLLALLLYSEPGFPLYEDTDLGRATAHQLYCFAIEVWFGANGARCTLYSQAGLPGELVVVFL